MKDHDKYIKNVIRYYEDGMPIDEAIDKAIAIDYLGEDLIQNAGEDTQTLLGFVKVINNYINLCKNYENS